MWDPKSITVILNEWKIARIIKIDLVVKGHDCGIDSERAKCDFSKFTVLCPKRNPDYRYVAKDTEKEMHQCNTYPERKPQNVSNDFGTIQRYSSPDKFSTEWKKNHSSELEALKSERYPDHCQAKNDSYKYPREKTFPSEQKGPYKITCPTRTSTPILEGDHMHLPLRPNR